MENSLQNQPEKDANQLTTLTEQNWLFINAFLASGSIKKAYRIAGYVGKDASAPYQLFKQLKGRIEELGNLDVTSRARLQADLSVVLDLPLANDKKELSLSEWLRVRKFVAAITPEVAAPRPSISVLVIHRGNGTDKDDGKGTINVTPTSLKDVIDVPEELNP